MNCSIHEKADLLFLNRKPSGRKNTFRDSISTPLFLFSLLLLIAGTDVKAQAMVPGSNTARIRQAWSRPESRNSARSNSRDNSADKRGVTEGRNNEVLFAGSAHPGGIRGSSAVRQVGRQTLSRVMSVHHIPPAWSPEEPPEDHPEDSQEESEPGKPESKHPEEPEKPVEPRPDATPPPPSQAPAAEPSTTVQAASPPPKPLPIRGSKADHGGAACIAVLKEHGVSFVEGEALAGVRTPIKLTGPINGISFRSRWTPDEEPVMDCLLALALLKASNIFKSHDVDVIVYSSIYRPPRRNRPSRHAQGLAIDVRDVTFKDRVTLNVLRDWRKTYGRPNNCVGDYTTDNSVRLRRIICDLEEANIFRRILTPDSDPDHDDHFHISAGRPGETWERSRWAGRNLYQPLPGTRLFPSWYEWYGCYRQRGRGAITRCYRARRPSWVVSGNPYRFTTHRYKSFLGPELASIAHVNNGNSQKDENTEISRENEDKKRDRSTAEQAAKVDKAVDSETRHPEASR